MSMHYVAVRVTEVTERLVKQVEAILKQNDLSVAIRQGVGGNEPTPIVWRCLCDLDADDTESMHSRLVKAIVEKIPGANVNTFWMNLGSRSWDQVFTDTGVVQSIPKKAAKNPVLIAKISEDEGEDVSEDREDRTWWIINRKDVCGHCVTGTESTTLIPVHDEDTDFTCSRCGIACTSELPGYTDDRPVAYIEKKDVCYVCLSEDERAHATDNDYYSEGELHRCTRCEDLFMSSGNPEYQTRVLFEVDDVGIVCADCADGPESRSSDHVTEGNYQCVRCDNIYTADNSPPVPTSDKYTKPASGDEDDYVFCQDCVDDSDNASEFAKSSGPSGQEFECESCERSFVTS